MSMAVIELIIVSLVFVKEHRLGLAEDHAFNTELRNQPQQPFGSGRFHKWFRGRLRASCVQQALCRHRPHPSGKGVDQKRGNRISK